MGYGSGVNYLRVLFSDFINMKFIPQLIINTIHQGIIYIFIFYNTIGINNPQHVYWDMLLLWHLIVVVSHNQTISIFTFGWEEKVWWIAYTLFVQFPQDFVDYLLTYKKRFLFLSKCKEFG